jgi:hypothetical protein
MYCSKILDLIYEYSGSEHDPEYSMPLFSQIQVWLHTFFCPYCAEKIRRMETAKNIMREDFFPYSPDYERSIEESIMARIALEENETAHYSTPGGISTRGWVIAGLVVLVSLATAYMGLDFQKVASETGMSFLLPVGITVGIILTVYGIFFIASHLKEFIERFDL